MTLEVELWDTANTAKVGDVHTDGSDYHGFTRGDVSARRCAVGAGSVTVRNDHPLSAQFTAGRHLRWYVDGTLAHTTVIRERERVNVSARRGAGQLTEVRSLSIVDEWRKALVLPYGGVTFRPTSKDRAFGAHSPELPLGSWSPVVVQYSGISSAISGVPGFEPWLPPVGWPGPLDDVDWIFVDDSILDDPPVFPSGRFVMRGTFSNPSTQDLWFAVSADDRARLCLDGVEVIGWTQSYPAADSFRKTFREVVPDVSSGSHHWSIELEVFAGNPSGPRRGMAAACVHRLPGTGEMLGADTFIAGTGSGWVCRPTPDDFLSCTPGLALQSLLTGAQAVGLLSGWTLSCSATLDSNGDAWSTGVLSPVKVGDSLLSVLQSWADQGVAEFRASNTGKVLHLFNPGGLGDATAAQFTAGVDLVEDSESFDLDVTNTLLVETGDGWQISSRGSSVSAYGAQGGALSLTGVERATQVTSTADAVHDVQAEPRRSRAVEVRPGTADDMPGSGFVEGDTVTVGAEVLRVETWSVSQDGNRPPVFALELVTSRQVAEERLGQRLDTLEQMSLGGRTAASVVLPERASGLPSGEVRRVNFPPHGPLDTDLLAPEPGVSKQLRNDQGSARVTTFECQGLWIDAGDFPGTRTDYVAAVQRNGTNVGVITLVPDDFEKVVLIEDCLFSETDTYNCAGLYGAGITNVTMQVTAVEAI